MSTKQPNRFDGPAYRLWILRGIAVDALVRAALAKHARLDHTDPPPLWLDRVRRTAHRAAVRADPTGDVEFLAHFAKAIDRLVRMAVAGITLH